MTKILILCTGNSCRSQMAEAFLKSFDKTLLVYSAGTFPSKNVHPLAIKVMRELGIDISKNIPKNVKLYLKQDFDYVITVCNDAKETCPYFSGIVKKRLHIGFEDPAKIQGNGDFVLNEFRRIRDEIFLAFEKLYKKELKRKVKNKHK